MNSTSKRPLVVWIVEDSDKDALLAADVIAQVAKDQGIEFEVYWDKTIRWDSLLSEPPPSQYRPLSEKDKHRPDIVILDLFTSEGFLAKDFFLKLRDFERYANAPRAWVILWSVKTGDDEAQDLIYKEPERDRRVVFSESKQPIILIDKFARCVKSWKGARFS